MSVRELGLPGVLSRDAAKGTDALCRCTQALTHLPS